MTRIYDVQARVLKDIYKSSLEKKGHTFFESGAYNINIIGVRSTEQIPNKFNDSLIVLYKRANKEWVADTHKITTDPGVYWLNNPMNVAGTAILVPGQYRGVYKIDGHGQTKYEALCQRAGTVKVYRDNNKDEVHDMEPSTITEGYYGINIHRASKSREITEDIDKWSAGCQVFKSNADFSGFMTIVNTSAKRYGNRFTYTLLDEKDLEVR